ncbi:MAG: 30S ribosomal protein S4 [Pseudomonadota bacterium]
MTKRIQAKYKIDRRYGINLWGRPKSPYNKRNYGPGEQGQKPRKLSDYGLQLAAKQKLKGYYGNLNERQFRNLYQTAEQKRGDTSENLIGLLERRLDAVIYRMKLIPTVFSARQLISHGHILVNGRRVTIPSYRVREGDEIELRSRMHDNPVVLGAVQSSEREVPEYVEIDHGKMKGRFVRTPNLEEVAYPVQMEPNLVIEYYSR